MLTVTGDDAAPSLDEQLSELRARVAELENRLAEVDDSVGHLVDDHDGGWVADEDGNWHPLGNHRAVPIDSGPAPFGQIA